MLVPHTHKFPWALFAIQQIAVPFVSLLATGCLSALLASAIPASKAASDLAGVIAYVSPGLFGFALGALARSLGTAFRQAGRWIWVAPASLFTVAFLATLLIDWRGAIPSFFG